MKTDPAIAELIRTQHSARAARSEAGFQRSHQRPVWFDVNVEVMDTVLRAKFTQHDDLRRTLLETGNRELVEDSPVRCSLLSRCKILGGLNKRKRRTTCFGGPEETVRGAMSLGKR